MRGQTARLLRKLADLDVMKDENELKREWYDMNQEERTVFRKEGIELLNQRGKNTKSL